MKYCNTVSVLFLLLFICRVNGLDGRCVSLDENLSEIITEIEDEKTYIIHAPINDINEFRELAEQVSVLKSFGRVLVNISTLADKSFHEIPDGRNHWYEYASYNPTPFKFFPDEKIKPFIPQSFVEKNKILIKAKAEILREYGLKAAFWSYEPNFLPYEFFDQYPQMLGPRVDHPRRSNEPAFAPCISVKATRDMYRRMVSILLKEVPEIEAFFFKTNDAGSGICWSDWQYTGPNGPLHCKDVKMGSRVQKLMNTFKEGANDVGKDIEIYLTGSMFSDEEKAEIYENLPSNCFFQSHNSDKVSGLKSGIVSKYPIRGFIDPIGTIEDVVSTIQDNPQTIFISFRASYDRGYENKEGRQFLLDIVTTALRRKEALKTEELFKEFLKDRGVKKLGEEFYQICKEINKAEEYRSDSVKGLSNIYWTISTRHILRPLVFNPLLLNSEEERYFLPEVFNTSQDEARLDYADIHGGRWSLPYNQGLIYALKLDSVANDLIALFEKSKSLDFVKDWSRSIRIQSSLARTAVHFAEAQKIRDQNRIEIEKGPHGPGKESTWSGDEDLLKFNEIMRQEFDNTQNLIELLENEGMDLICHAVNSVYEDTFLLGPDLIDQLKLKRKIMMKHWTDIEKYLTTPLK